MDLTGSRVLLTGASGGLGGAIARRLHARGADLVLTARRVDLLEDLRSELGGRAEVLPADLSDLASVAALAERAGRVDVLVANAGLPGSGNLLGFETAQVDRVLDVNLRAPIQLTRALLPAMKERGYGHIVFMSSMSGKVASPGASLYAATKFGLRGFALGLHNDLVGSGIGVTTVFPGFVRDAGLLHDSGAKLPFYVGTSTPRRVAKAVSRGIEHDKLEINVAPGFVRFGALLAGVAPRTVGAAQRRLGGAQIAESIARGQVSKR